MLAYVLRQIGPPTRSPRNPQLTLLDMLRLFASEWNEVVRQLEALGNIFNTTTSLALAEGPKDAVLGPLRNIERLCRHLHLSNSEVYATRLIARIEQTPTLTEQGQSLLMRTGARREPVEIPRIEQEASILRERIDDELSRVELFVLDSGKGKYLTDPYLFGVEVANRFPPAADDIEEAGKCFAFDRYTACVFHLMRVTEVGLRALGSSLNEPSLDPKTNPTWDRILSRCDKELQKPYAERSPEWRTNQQFFADATANLRAVKDAWRNPSLHVERSYDDEKAREIWNAVRAFMRHLATKL